ncbi:MAG: tyrosine-type recombinase/integrase [Candidatus Micrarchaeia archaeon]
MMKKYRPWKQQIALQNQDIPSPEEILDMIEKVPYLKWKALFSLVYLTAARINEVIQVTTPEDFRIIERDGRKILLITLYNEKHKKRKIKKIPIVPVNIVERKLANYVIEYTNLFSDVKDVMWNISHQRAWKIFKKYLKMNPHFLRHIRLTHLVTEYNFNEHELKMYAGWTDTRPSSRYVEMRWTDILNKFSQKK